MDGGRRPFLLLMVFTALLVLFLDVPRQRVEQWEQQLTNYVERTEEEISDSMKRAVVRSICPDILQDHLDLNVTRLDTYQKVRTEIDRYVDQTVSKNGPTPMELDSMMQQWPKKPPGKGKDPKN